LGLPCPIYGAVYGLKASYRKLYNEFNDSLRSSVNEISRQVQESARIASEAVDQARGTNERVGELSKAASRIGDVVALINTIAA
jgi:methyl-accepting chemotaxis protein